jgi:hypothetical protein
MATIPNQAAEWLAADPTPSRQKAFDDQFGKGQAAATLGNLKPKTEAPKSWKDTVVSAIKKAPGDIAEGIAESPLTIAGGLFEGAIVDPANFLASQFGTVRLNLGGDRPTVEYLSPEEWKAFHADKNNNDTFNNIAKAIKERTGDTFTGGMIQEVSAFTGAWLGLGKVFKGASLASRGARAGGAVFLSREASEGRISDFLIEMGIPKNDVTEFLKTNPDDSEIVGRLKNVVEEGALGLVADSVLRMVKAVRAGDTKALEGISKEIMDAKEAADTALAKRAAGDIDVANKPPPPPPPPPEPALAPVTDAGPNLESIGFVDTATPPKVEAPAPSSANTPAPAGGPKPRDKFSLTPEQNANIEGIAHWSINHPEGPIRGDMGWRSPDLIESLPQVDAEIHAMRDVLDAKFAKLNPTQTEAGWKMQAGRIAKSLGEKTGVDDDAILRHMEGFKNPRLMAAEMIARDNYALSLTRSLTELAEAVYVAGDTGSFRMLSKMGYTSIEEAKLALLKRRELAANVIASVQGQRSNIARALRATQIVRKGDKQIMELINSPKGSAMLDDADAVAEAVVRARRAAGELGGTTGGTAGGTAESILEASTKGADRIRAAGKMINTYRINAMLSGPGTQEVNFISNLVQGLAIPTQQALGAAVSLNKTQALHAGRTLRHSLGSAWESLQTALRAGYNDEAILDPFNGKLDIEQVKSTNIGSKVVQAPSRFLLTADELFKQAQYRGRVAADALMEADARGLSGLQRTEYVKRYIRESFTDDGAATRGDALLQAQRSTFTEPLDGDISRSIQRFAANHAIVRFIIPFVRTPLNILSQGFQSMPVMGAMSSRWRADIRAGGSRAAQAKGKQVIGTSLVVMGAHLASEGLITGGGPNDPKVRKQWLETNSPYSFRIQNEDGSVSWQPYGRLEPLAYPLAIVSDLVTILEHSDNISRFEREEAIKAVTMAIAENTVNKTFTRGISDFMKLLVDQSPETSSSVLNNMVGTFVPNAIPQVLNNDEKVEVRTFLDALRSRVGMDGDMDRKRNGVGEVSKNYGAKYDPMRLFVGDTRQEDKLINEFTRLSEIHQSSFGQPPSRIGEADLKRVKYEGNQSLYDRWLEVTSEIKLGGKTLRQRLEQIISTDQYKRLKDGNRDITGHNEKVLKKVISKYRKAARRQLIRESDAFREVFIEYERSKHDLKRPNILEQ